MICHFTLLELLWGEALKTTTYLVPTKPTTETPYELWMGKKPSLKHLHVWVFKLRQGVIGRIRRNWT